MNLPFPKPDGTEEGIQSNHYTGLLGAYMLCTHTCAKGIEHNNPDYHSLTAELKTLPDATRTGELVQLLVDEYMAHNHLPPHIQAAIWNQLQRSLTA